MTRRRKIVAGEVTLHVVEAGEPGRPPILLVHGFPDAHDVYDHVLDDLARDFHVATFDLRGVAASSPPARASGYRIEAILPDFTAVIDAVFGADARVHLVGHDWGSVLGFSYLCAQDGRARVRSFTSVSGPHVALMWAASFDAARHGGLRGLRTALRQLASSSYVFALQLPLVPELAIAAFGERICRSALLRGGVPASDPYLEVSREEAARRMRYAIALYRQNALRPPPLPARGSITTPLLVLVPVHDPFVRPEVHARLDEYATDLVIRRIDASHWVPRSHPALLADAVRAHATAVDRDRPDAEEGMSWR